MTTPLSDPDNVLFTVVDDYEAPGFTPSEVAQILHGTSGSELPGSLTAAGKKNNLKEYWTRGKGLGKWVDKAHPWTELYGHLKKYMPDEMAKRVASEWYHEVKGHWPGEKGKK